MEEKDDDGGDLGLGGRSAVHQRRGSGMLIPPHQRVRAASGFSAACGAGWCGLLHRFYYPLETGGRQQSSR